MKRNRLSVIFAVLACICIFSVAAIYNQCQIQQEEKEAPTIKLEIYEGPIYLSDDGACCYRVKANVTGAPIPDVVFLKDDSDGTLGKYIAQVNLYDSSEIYTLTATATNLEGTASDSIEISWGCDGDKEIEQGEAPTIELEIYEGPLSAEGDDICYYRIKAIVTGSPIPTIEFSKDDSNEALGKYIAQVNLYDSSEIYTLIATATNLEGTASDSINLGWGCSNNVAREPLIVVDLTSLETQILNLINNIRVSNGLGVLQPNQILTDIARSRCSDMINRSYFSHYTPDGKNIFNILKENGVSYVNAGENLGKSTPASSGTPEAFANAWMASPTHKANIVRSVYSKIGIGVVDGGGRRVVATVFTN